MINDLVFRTITLLALFAANGAIAKQPNVLLIVSEDNGPELGCYGDPFANTPHLDRLASEGIRFDRAFVPQAGCSQSRASVLTGLYPHQHGQLGLATWRFRLYREDTPNLPKSLKAAGYRTGIIGKLHINPASAFPFDFHEITGANFGRKNLQDYARHAKSFIESDDRPFFLSVNYPDAHDPWIRQVDGLPKRPLSADDVKSFAYMGIDPPGLREMVADYYNCMSRLDSLVGDLLSVLDRSGKASNTIVVYLGDHGPDMLRGKRTCYEGGLRIPMMIRWRGKIDAQTRHEFVSTIDLMPTLLAAAQAEMPKGLPGQNLQPLFDEESTPSWRQYLFAEYHTHAAAANYFPQRCVRNERYKLIESLLPDTVHPDYADTIRKLHGDHSERETDSPLDLHAAIDNATPAVNAAYQIMKRPPRYQLYDLQSDPFEFQNLADSSEHTVPFDELKQQLNQWRLKTNDPLMNPLNLRKLTNELQSVRKKSFARKRDWKYPDYFFGD